MIYVIITILFMLALANAFTLFLLMRELIHFKKNKQEDKWAVTVSEPKQEPTSAEVDTKATNAERLYLEGIQSILSYDLNTMKQYLKGVEEE